MRITALVASGLVGLLICDLALNFIYFAYSLLTSGSPELVPWSISGLLRRVFPPLGSMSTLVVLAVVAIIVFFGAAAASRRERREEEHEPKPEQHRSGHDFMR